MAAELGIEPRQRDSETLVLPLHNSAIIALAVASRIYYTPKIAFVKSFRKTFDIFLPKKEVRGENSSDQTGNLSLFQALLVSLNHLLDHLATDGTGLLGGQVTVVALLQVDAHLVGGLHLETVQTLAGLGHYALVVHAVHTSLSHAAVLPPQIRFAFANLLCAATQKIQQTICDKSNQKIPPQQNGRSGIFSLFITFWVS